MLFKGKMLCYRVIWHGTGDGGGGGGGGYEIK